MFLSKHCHISIKTYTTLQLKNKQAITLYYFLRNITDIMLLVRTYLFLLITMMSLLYTNFLHIADGCDLFPTQHEISLLKFKITAHFACQGSLLLKLCRVSASLASNQTLTVSLFHTIQSCGIHYVTASTTGNRYSTPSRVGFPEQQYSLSACHFLYPHQCDHLFV